MIQLYFICGVFLAMQINKICNSISVPTQIVKVYFCVIGFSKIKKMFSAWPLIEAHLLQGDHLSLQGLSLCLIETLQLFLRRQRDGNYNFSAQFVHLLMWHFQLHECLTTNTISFFHLWSSAWLMESSLCFEVFSGVRSMFNWKWSIQLLIF